MCNSSQLSEDVSVRTLHENWYQIIPLTLEKYKIV